MVGVSPAEVSMRGTISIFATMFVFLPVMADAWPGGTPQNIVDFTVQGVSNRIASPDEADAHARAQLQNNIDRDGVRACSEKLGGNVLRRLPGQTTVVPKSGRGPVQAYGYDRYTIASARATNAIQCGQEGPRYHTAYIVCKQNYTAVCIKAGRY